MKFPDERDWFEIQNKLSNIPSKLVLATFCLPWTWLCMMPSMMPTGQ
jgi:hypothetical protein